MKKGSVHIRCAKTQTLQLWIKYMKSLVTPNLDQLHKIGPLSDSLFLHPRTFPNELPKQLRQVIAFLVAGGDLTQYLSGDAGKCCNWLVYSSSGKTNKHLHIKKSLADVNIAESFGQDTWCILHDIVSTVMHIWGFLYVWRAWLPCRSLIILCNCLSPTEVEAIVGMYPGNSSQRDKKGKFKLSSTSSRVLQNTHTHRKHSEVNSAVLN